MTYTIVTISTTADARLAQTLLPASECVASGNGRLYLLYPTFTAADYRYCDLDGDELIAVRGFRSLVAAQAWVEQDVRRTG